MKAQNISDRFRSAFRKTIFTVAAIVSVASTNVTLGATGPEPAASSLQTTVFQLPESLKFKMIVAPGENEKLHITIRNQKNEAIYTESLKGTNGYIRKFDFSSLGDGEYTFEISNGNQTQSKTFKIETNTARVVTVN